MHQRKPRLGNSLRCVLVTRWILLSPPDSLTSSRLTLTDISGRLSPSATGIAAEGSEAVSDESNGLHDGTAAAMLRFLAWAVDKSELPGPRVNNMKVAVNRVLDVEGDSSGVDIRTLDVESILDRFEIKNRVKYNSDSMATYKSRFRVAVETYRAFLAGGSEWKAIGRGTRGTPRVRKPPLTKVAPPGKKAASPDTSTQAADTPTVTPDRETAMITYDYPLRPNLIVRLALPVGLTSSDAARLASFIQSLAFVPEEDKEARA